MERLREFLSVEHRHGDDLRYLNLERCFHQISSMENSIDDPSITAISLAHNFLFHLPKFVSNFTNLIEFNLSDNHFYQTDLFLHNGDSSSQFRPLIFPFLQHLNLSFNHFQLVPFNLQYLRFLKTLNLSHNYLHRLPDDFGLLEQLKILQLNHNKLTELPKTFSRLSNLERLNLSHNQFASLDLVKNLPNLVELNLSSNPLQRFPLLLSSCSNLEELSLAQTNLHQFSHLEISYFRQFPHLKKFDLAKNQLTDRFFLSSSNEQFSYPFDEVHLQHNQLVNLDEFLSQIDNLTSLDLTGNCFRHLPRNFSLRKLRISSNEIELRSEDFLHFKSLVELDLDHNRIDEIPNEILHCQSLESLNISFNHLNKFPSIVLRLRSLRRLVTGHQRTPWKILSINDSIRTLTVLDLSHQQLSNNCVELTLIKSLIQLDLSFNQIQQLDEEFRSMTCLRVLKLAHNKFTEFPSCLCERPIASTLVELDLSHNRISTIPEDILHMTNLESIDLSNNIFQTFPEPLVYLEQLINLSYSQSSGIRIDSLPDDFNNFGQLKTLDLSHNCFLEFPTVIYDLPKLIKLNFNDNLLTGVDFSRLKHLKNLQLNGNEFSSFPSSIYQLNTFEIHHNSVCFSPPNDFLDENSKSSLAHRFVVDNDQFDEKLLRRYEQIFVEFLPEVDLERFLLRLKLSSEEIEEFRQDSQRLKRQEKVELLFRRWKEKRGLQANAQTLYRITKTIGDKRLLQQMQRATIFARKIHF